MNRRDFLRRSRHGLAVAAPMVGVAAAASTELYDDLSRRLSETTDTLFDSLKTMGRETRQAVARIDRIEMQQNLILALLVLSFIIDGGVGWMLLSPELLSAPF